MLAHMILVSPFIDDLYSCTFNDYGFQKVFFFVSSGIQILGRCGCSSEL